MTVIHLTPLLQGATDRVAADATLIARASFPYVVDGAAVVAPKQLRFDFRAGQPSPVVELEEPDGFAWLLHLMIGSWVQVRAVMWVGAELDWSDLTDVNPATLTTEGVPSMPTGKRLISAVEVAATYVAVQPTAPDPTKITAWVDNTTAPPTVKGWNGTTWVAIGGGGGGAVSSVAGRTGAVTLTKSDVGLSSVDNTSDASKPVSTAQQAAISAAVAALPAGAASTTHQVRRLADYPVMATPPTATFQTSSAALSGATSTITGTLFTPLWAASTFYPAGSTVMHPTDTNSVIRRTADGTSRATYDATEQGLWTTAAQGTRVNFPMRWNCGFIRQRTINASNEYGPRNSKATDGSEETAATFESIWSIDYDWYTVAGAFEIALYSAGPVRVVIDGAYASVTPYAFGSEDYAWRYLKLTGITAGFHRVRLEMGGAWSMTGGIKIATGDQVFPPSMPKTKSLAFVGDSIGNGYMGTAGGNNANHDPRGFTGQLARLLGISDFLNCSIASTGFTTPSTKTYAARLADLVALNPDYLVIQGSSNDTANVGTTLSAAARSFYTNVLSSLPNTKIIATGCINKAYATDTVTPVLMAAATAAGMPFIDTSDWNVLSQAGMNSDGTHPTLIGHDYLARRLATVLSAAWGLQI